MSSLTLNQATLARRLTVLGALLLLLSILGYLLYELILRPRAGFPSDDMAVILGGVKTLKVGHWLKFAYAVGTALLTAGLIDRFRSLTPLTTLMLLVGSGASALFIASGMLGLNLLDTAQSLYPQQLSDARATILIRIVTISLFGAALFLVGGLIVSSSLAGLLNRAWSRFFAGFGIGVGVLLILEFMTPEPWVVVAPVLGIVWLGWLMFIRDSSKLEIQQDL
ncbi:MAG: hypothetical protein KC422_22360 [Trueperaceae bacterium]|nr:hypothetical protein [Trueperaceae bacterium]